MALGLAVCLVVAGAARAESVDRPALSAGDYWTYATNSTVASGLILLGQVTSRVAARETADLGGRSMDVYRLVLNGSGTASVTLPPSLGSLRVTANWLLTGEDLLEASQLKVVSSLLGLDVTGTGLTQFTIQVQNTTTYVIRSDGWQYPLAPGTSGSVTMDYNYSQTIYSSFFNTTHTAGNGSWTAGFTMGAAETVSVPAGRFQTYPIVETWPDGTKGHFVFAPAAGNDVRTETYNETDVRTSTTELLAYRYQAAEPPTFLGLSLAEWLVVVVVVAAAVVIVYLRRRKGRPAPPLEDEGPAT